jgi:hypothetical protein
MRANGRFGAGSRQAAFGRGLPLVRLFRASGASLRGDLQEIRPTGRNGSRVCENVIGPKLSFSYAGVDAKRMHLGAT